MFTLQAFEPQEVRFSLTIILCHPLSPTIIEIQGPVYTEVSQKPLPRDHGQPAEGSSPSGSVTAEPFIYASAVKADHAATFREGDVPLTDPVADSTGTDRQVDRHLPDRHPRGFDGNRIFCS